MDGEQGMSTTKSEGFPEEKKILSRGREKKGSVSE